MLLLHNEVVRNTVLTSVDSVINMVVDRTTATNPIVNLLTNIFDPIVKANEHNVMMKTVSKPNINQPYSFKFTLLFKLKTSKSV